MTTLRFPGTATLDWTFTPDLTNRNSEAFGEIEQKFCTEVECINCLQNNMNNAVMLPSDCFRNSKNHAVMFSCLRENKIHWYLIQNSLHWNEQNISILFFINIRSICWWNPPTWKRFIRDVKSGKWGRIDSFLKTRWKNWTEFVCLAIYLCTLLK